MSSDPSLWAEGELPEFPGGIGTKDFKSLRYPLWTQNKAKLIRTYLRFFEFITHHGTYIDGFAAPQDANYPDTWAAKLVLEIEPKWFRDFWLCDISPTGLKRLEALRDEHAGPKRKITVLSGDFNDQVSVILGSGRITEDRKSVV